MKLLFKIINIFRPFRFKYWVCSMHHTVYNNTFITRNRLNPSLFDNVFLLGGPFDIYEDAVKFKNEQKSV